MYETHITVDPTTPVSNLKDFCLLHGYKLIDIRLDKGIHQRQLMITAQFNHAKDLPAMYDFYDAVVKTKRAGFSVLRKKLEAADLIGGSDYYEAHWKLTFPNQVERVKEQKKLSQENGIHVSFNGRKEKSNILYLTVRHKDMDLFNKLCEDKDDVIRKNYRKAKFHNERVVIDSDVDLDKGWTH